ncbi:MAG: homoserine O-acetyltransferase MetX [Opitutales bacterium]
MNDAESGDLTDQPGEVGLVRPRDFHETEAFTFESGQTIPELFLRYESYGRLNKDRSNAVLICHALSGDHHVAGVHAMSDRKPGWWNNMVGPGKPIDTRRFFVLCANCIGGCQGSVGPSSTNPATGKPYGLDFPAVTIGDMVVAQARLLDHLGIERLHAVIGGSMGGMQALEWAIRFPRRVAHCIGLATTARQGTQAIAFNEVGRSAIMQDPEWRGGDYAKDAGPNVGLAIARMMAHITYLSDKGLENKFGRRTQVDHSEPTDARQQLEVEFAVESYLRYQGRSFVNRFDANTYLYFTKALDRYDLYGPDNRLEAALEPLSARTMIIGFTSDWLFPPAQNRAVVEALLRLGKEASYAELTTDLGHDSFLVHAPQLYALINAFLAGDRTA